MHGAPYLAALPAGGVNCRLAHDSPSVSKLWQATRAGRGATPECTKEVIGLPRTGQQASQSGIYANDCHAKEIALSVGEKFPPCSHCHRAANWRLVRATR